MASGRIFSEIRSERCWKMDEHGWTWMEMEDPAGKWMDSRNDSALLLEVSHQKCHLMSAHHGWWPVTLSGKNPKPPPPLYSGRRCPWGNSLRPKHPAKKVQGCIRMDAHSAHLQHFFWVSNLLFWWLMLTADPTFFPTTKAPNRDRTSGGSGLDEPDRCPATVALMCAGPQMMPVIVALLTVKGVRVYIDLTQNDMNDSLWESSMFLSTLQIQKNHLIYPLVI